MKRQNRNVVVTSVVVGVVSMILMGVLKGTIGKIPLFRRLLKFKNLGLDSVKDFLEISELNYRAFNPEDLNVPSNPSDDEFFEVNPSDDNQNSKSTSNQNRKEDNKQNRKSENYQNRKEDNKQNRKSDNSAETGHDVTWDEDGSESYVIFISSDPMPKENLFDFERIPYLLRSEVENLKNSSNWTRRVPIGIPFNRLAQNNYSTKNYSTSNYSTNNHSRKNHSTNNHSTKNYNKNEKTDKRKNKNNDRGSDGIPDLEREILGSEILATKVHLPFSKFYSRIRSSNGRISQEISYPLKASVLEEFSEVETSIFKTGRDYYLKITQLSIESGPIYDYKVILYISDRRGHIINVLPFSDKIVVKLGDVPPCLCYLTGVRGVGTMFEHFVAWIGEDAALTINNELDQYIDPDF